MLGGMAAISFVLTLLALGMLLSKLGHFALDRPNERSLHERPVPRTGGIALLVGAMVSLAFGAAALWHIIVLALALAIVSFADDVRSLPTAARLGAHLVTASVLAWYLLSPMQPLEL